MGTLAWFAFLTAFHHIMNQLGGLTRSQVDAITTLSDSRMENPMTSELLWGWSATTTTTITAAVVTAHRKQMQTHWAAFYLEERHLDPGAGPFAKFNTGSVLYHDSPCGVSASCSRGLCRKGLHPVSAKILYA
ncbi:hypothetical protein A6R68_03160 [Neotoma lepida]|uniref:Uncharacterized protein n=1 Tax=Neotoma lepida TaxID=56216 RepID=A0A1A6GQZ5_NEOLE|nr:hypothetical protein A6R68_03160 [Neotoma lepida]